MSNTYELIVVRYQKEEGDGMQRSEFFPMEIDRAKAFFFQKQDEDVHYVEARELLVYRGAGGERLGKHLKWEREDNDV